MFSGATIVSSSVTSHACVKIRVVALTALIVTIVASIAKDHHGVPTAKGGTKLPTDRVPCILIDMRCLQANVRSLNTSRSLLELTALDHRSKMMLLQETWALKGMTDLKDFLPPLFKQRVNQEGGGVAIFVLKTAKIVPLNQYDVKDLEAVWADAMTGQVRSVVGSVYIAPGQVKQLDVFREQLGKICRDFPRVIVGMDANVRHPLWYDNIVTHRSVNKKMGERLAKIFDRLLVGGFWTTTSSQTTLQSN